MVTSPRHSAVLVHYDRHAYALFLELAEEVFECLRLGDKERGPGRGVGNALPRVVAGRGKEVSGMCDAADVVQAFPVDGHPAMAGLHHAVDKVADRGARLECRDIHPWDHDLAGGCPVQPDDSADHAHLMLVERLFIGVQPQSA